MSTAVGSQEAAGEYQYHVLVARIIR
jgi:hypothetical protein